MQISTALHSKAQRLVDSDKVAPLKRGRMTYQVLGDSGSYVVHLSYPQEATGSCSCPSKASVCSHILAASISYLADPPTVTVPTTDPFEGII